LNNLGYLYCEKGEYKEADSLLSRALLINLDHLPSDHPEFAKVYGSLAWILNMIRLSLMQKHLLKQLFICLENRILLQKPVEKTLLRSIGERAIQSQQMLF
jgi:hypothetical protein